MSHRTLLLTPSLLLALSLSACLVKDDGDEPVDSDSGADTNVEAGCITIDGEGGYAHIVDAVAAAPAGATLAVCAGTYDENVVVDRSVTIVGDGAIIVAPSNEVPFTITAADVTIQGFEIQSTRDAVVVDGAADTALVGLAITAAGGWGVDATGATGLSLRDSTITGVAQGGVNVSGGDATVSGVTMTAPQSFGINAEDADLTVEDTTIVGTVMLSDDVTDGIGINTVGGTVTLRGGSVDASGGVGLWTDGTAVDIDGTSFDSNVYLNLFAVATTFTATGLTASNAELNGAYVVATEADIASSSFSADPEGSCVMAYADWGQSNNPWCGTLLVAADSVTLTDVDATGGNNYGIRVGPANVDQGEMTVVGGTISDVGGWAFDAVGMAGTITGLTVTGTRNAEDFDPCSEYEFLNYTAAAMRLWEVEVTLDGVVLRDNAAFGIMALLNTQTIQNSTFDGNACAGLFDYQGATTITGNTFTNTSASGSLYAYQDVMTVEENTFVDNHTTSVYETEFNTGAYAYGDGTTTTLYSGFEWVDVPDMTITVDDVPLTEGTDWTAWDADADGDYDGATFATPPASGSLVYFQYLLEYRSESSNGGLDIYGAEPALLTITKNTFTDGDDSIRVSGGSVIVTENEWTGYAGSIFETYQATDRDPALFASNTVTSSVGPIVSDTYGHVEVEDVQVNEMVAGTTSYAYYYDDVLEYSYSYSTVQPAFYAYGYASGDGSTLYEASITVEGVTFTGDTAGAILQATDATIVLRDLAAEAVSTESNTAAILASWSAFPAAIEIEDVVVTSSDGQGVSLTNTSTDAGYATLDTVTIGAAASDCVSAKGLTALDLTAVTLGSCTGDGVSSISANSWYAYDYETYTYDYPLQDFATAVTADDLRVGNATANAVSLEGGSASITNLEVEAASGHGVLALGLSSLTIDEVAIGSAGADGVNVLDTVSFTNVYTSEVTTIDGDTSSTLTKVTVAAAGGDGLDITGGSLSVSDSSASYGVQNGVRLESVRASASANTFSNNGEYGMMCTDVSFDVCSGNLAEDNGSGAVSGCDASCVE